METSDLDLPLLPSAEQIRRREFASVRRGYDPQQVRDYLIQVAAQVETLERDLHERSDGLPPKPTGIEALAEIADAPARQDPPDDPYQRVAQKFAVVFETADHEAEEILGRARDEATRLLTEARSDADRMRVDAQARAEEARQEGREALERAKREADETMGDLLSRRTTLIEQLDGMRTTLLAVAEDLRFPGAEADDEADARVADDASDATTTEQIAEPGPTAVEEHAIAAAPAAAAEDDDEDWLFEGGLDLPELEFTDTDQDE